MPSYVGETRLMMNSRSILPVCFSSYGIYQFLPHISNSALRMLTEEKGDYGYSQIIITTSPQEVQHEMMLI